MLTFLFWNLAKRANATAVAALAQENAVDILLLAENAIPQAALLSLLNPPGNARYYFTPSLVPSKVDIFFGYSPEFIRPQADTGRASIRKIQLPGRQEFLLCAVHLQSKPAWQDFDQAQESSELNTTIREHERQAGHSRTIVVGDFNMNPFAPGLTSANCFNAVMTHETALRRARCVAGRNHPFFFNPMWSHFSDGTSRPAGTFYLTSPAYESVYWHILDQVLIRPELIPHFDSSSLRILDSYSGGRLTGANGRPSTSDHLPIIFSLDV